MDSKKNSKEWVWLEERREERTWAAACNDFESSLVWVNIFTIIKHLCQRGGLTIHSRLTPRREDLSENSKIPKVLAKGDLEWNVRPLLSHKCLMIVNEKFERTFIEHIHFGDWLEVWKFEYLEDWKFFLKEWWNSMSRACERTGTVYDLKI